ncbi:exosortase T [Ruegeria arenilitoris]|uniref:exosortase T n=1 Tax=Ruegeria arenilitoris TaxID=1173585 RepID=UPI00147BF59F|nr:exosortase T [Ruegeria arenilitoris]
MKKPVTDSLAWMALALASVILAAQPLQWLVQSWVSPAYGSYGYLYVLLILALAGASILSGPATEKGANAPVLALLFGAALTRLMGQVLAINILSALALAVDVFALVRLLRLDRRPFALSPFWMAALFLFALPTEVILQRTLGFPLQMVSADISCRMLGLLFPSVICEGVRVTLENQDILVDLPCSGASGLLLATAFVVVQNAIMRPHMMTAILSVVAMAGCAVIGNSLRISFLAVGLVNQFDVMAEPWHSLIGLVSLGLTVLPFAWFYRPVSVKKLQTQRLAPARLSLPVAVICLLASFTIVSLKPEPVDVSGVVQLPAMPGQIYGYRAQNVPLTPLEATYFETYGGQAQKAQFGPLGLNVVSTRAPLRHLHAPEICLRGLGYKVRFLGTRYAGAPTAYYKAIGPGGDRWRVAVSYVSEDGYVTPSVGEAIWHWMAGSGGTWSSVQRITPWQLDPKTGAALEAAALASLDVQLIEGTDI